MWFTETPWPPILICLGLAGLCAAAWHSTRRGIALAGVVGLLGLCAVIFVAERLIITEIERVEAAVVDLAAAYEQRNLDRTLSFVSAEATGLRDLVRSSMEAYDVRDLRITDLSATTSGDDTALAHFRANATVAARRGSFGPAHYPTRWEFTWRREPGGWKLVEVQPLQVVSGDHDERLERHLGRQP